MDQYLIETLPLQMSEHAEASQVAILSLRCPDLEGAIAAAERTRVDLGIRTEVAWGDKIAGLQAGQFYKTKFLSGSANIRVTKLNRLNEPTLEPEDTARVRADYLFQAAAQDFVEALAAEASGKRAGLIANCRVVAGNGARDLGSKLSLPSDVILRMVHAEGRRRFEDEATTV